jgi:hypothetical protein
MRIGPGVYVDLDERPAPVLHVEVVEICEHLGWPVAGGAMLEAAIVKHVRLAALSHFGRPVEVVAHLGDRFALKLDEPARPALVEALGGVLRVARDAEALRADARRHGVELADGGPPAGYIGARRR